MMTRLLEVKRANPSSIRHGRREKGFRFRIPSRFRNCPRLIFILSPVLGLHKALGDSARIEFDDLPEVPR